MDFPVTQQIIQHIDEPVNANGSATAATRAKANFKRRVLLVVSGRVR